jgi:hypothetical protein
MDDADNDNLIRRFAISKVFIYAVCTLANNLWIAPPPSSQNWTNEIKIILGK